jgi:hypothetical protein
VGDSAVALLLGLTAGMLCYFANFSDTYLAWLGFSKEFFFYGARWPFCYMLFLLNKAASLKQAALKKNWLKS